MRIGGSDGGNDTDDQTIVSPRRPRFRDEDDYRKPQTLLKIPAPTLTTSSITIEVPADFDVSECIAILKRSHTWKILMESKLVELEFSYTTCDPASPEKNGKDE